MKRLPEASKAKPLTLVKSALLRKVEATPLVVILIIVLPLPTKRLPEASKAKGAVKEVNKLLLEKVVKLVLPAAISEMMPPLIVYLEAKRLPEASKAKPPENPDTVLL